MRVSVMSLVMTTLSFGATCVHSQVNQTPVPAVQLVREVVYNELHDHATHGFWRFRVQHRTGNHVLVEEQVETADGPVSRIALADGQPLTLRLEQEEENRLHHLLSSPGEQEHRRHQHQEDEQRIGRILALLPQAFLFDYDGEENGCYRLRFRPNPDYSTLAVEGRIFHAMSGTLWVDARAKHMARLEGRVGENLDFGFGILGRVYKGGWFLLQRTEVSPTEWKTERLEIHMNIRALLLKSFAQETSETRGEFIRVPAGINLAQGISMLQMEGSKGSSTEFAASGVHSLGPAPVLALRH